MSTSSGNLNDCLQFDQGIMRLSLFDPLSNQYETRILTLPELPLLESLESIFDITNSPIINNSKQGKLRMIKSCHGNTSSSSRVGNLQLNSISNNSNSNLIARRCQSNPNLSKRHEKQRKHSLNGGRIRSKRTLSNAFSAFTGFIQKAKNKKMKQQQPWSQGTYEIKRLSTCSSINSSISLSPYSKKLSNRKKQSYHAAKTINACENWWMSSPPIKSV